MRRTVGVLVLVVVVCWSVPGVAPLATADAPLGLSVIATRTVPAGAEIGAATTDGRFLAATGVGQVTVFDLTQPATLPEVCTFTPPGGGEPTSVDIVPNGKTALVAVKRDPSQGVVSAFDVSTCAPLWQVRVGDPIVPGGPIAPGPDSIVVTPNGQQALVALEAEESEIQQPSTTACPTAAGTPNSLPGRVDLLDLRPTGGPPSVRPVPIALLGVAGVNCQDDPQPEGLAVSGDSQLAYVTLQENNALATIDLRTGTVASVVSLGTTSHLADTENDDMPIVDDPFVGRRESDGIALSHDSRWLFTADEGDTSRRTVGGVTEFSGGRTMSVWSAARFEPGRGRPGASVTPPSFAKDTGSQIEEVAGRNGALPTGRARNRGPEPEGITTFKVGGKELAAVTLERSNAVIVFDISTPDRPASLAFLATGVSPEGVLYVPSRRLLITTNEGAPGVGLASITVICVRVGGADCR